MAKYLITTIYNQLISASFQDPNYSYDIYIQCLIVLTTQFESHLGARRVDHPNRLAPCSGQVD